MQCEQKKWMRETGWVDVSGSKQMQDAQLVLLFGATAPLKEKRFFDEVRSWYPRASIISCSTAGEIIDTEVLDGSLVLTAVASQHTTFSCTQTSIKGAFESMDAGRRLADALPKEHLVHVMVFSDGLKVNGTGLVKGLLEKLPATVSVTGGLVGDGSDFKQTLVGLNAPPEEGMIVVVGFYGERLKIGYGSLGGWDPFGPQRVITKSQGNILYELDGKPALKLYREYLGEQATGLPSTGLLFPLNIRFASERGGEVEVVRTILGIDEEAQSMTFAGDMPEGARAQLMKANFERLIDGASKAAGMSHEGLGSTLPDLAILISCIGRKLVLKERTVEEIEAVREVLGEKAAFIGFYSYGEICPVSPTEKQCQLHNQTMTITTFREI